MLLLLPFLFSTLVVSAAPHHQHKHRRDAKTHVHVITDTTTVVVTVYETAPVSSMLPTPVAQLSSSAAASVAAEAQYTGTTPLVAQHGVATPSASAPPASSSTSETPYASAQPSSAQPSSSSTSNDLGTLSRMTSAEVDAIYKTCWNGALPWPLPGTPNPVIDVIASQLSVFALPDATANTMTVNNYCSYDIYFDHYNQATNLETGKISAGSSINRPLSGTVLKASKTSDMEKVVLLEYGVDGDTMFYDMSMINCLGSTNGESNGDTSECAGHEHGLQLGSATAEMTFQCAPGVWCDDQAYLYQENLCKKQNPVFSTHPSHGLTMDFCASQKN